MKIAIVGTGAMGSVYAGVLAESGHEVWAIDQWQDHVTAINASGLCIEGPSGKRNIVLKATTDFAEPGICDLVVIATKAMDVRSAAISAAELTEVETPVLSIQNGLGGPDNAASVLGRETVMVGSAGGFGASVLGPGHVRHEGMELMRLGELAGPVTERLVRVAEIWSSAGFNVQVYDDIARLVWEKLVCNVAYSALCTVLECTIGEILADKDCSLISARCASEAYEVGRAQGIGFGFDDPRAYVVQFGERLLDARPSMLLDYLAGRRGEIDVINGVIPHIASEVGLQAPVNETLSGIVRFKEYSMLKCAVDRIQA